MNLLAHWIPTFVGVLILAIAGFVLDWRIRAEQRAHRTQGDRLDPEHPRGVTGG